ncbi:MAG: glycoside hydrolase family 3 C-terminal domain-containing protein [Oscillospiraceae bacterium]|nr:glycoside hydrolase family 3 C-terminal domain-containing protein [Oscillospiraceae bacterium]
MENHLENEHRALVRAEAPGCTVLLRANGDFPLAEPCPLALYGSGARHTVMGGTGSGEVNTRTFITAEAGLRAAGFTLTTDRWMDGYDAELMAARAAFIRELKARARKHHTLAVMEGMGAVMPEPEYDLPLDGEGRTAVYVLSRISGEGSDRQAVPGDILLTASEERDILALRRKYAKFLLVLNVGGPVDLSALGEVENILLLSQLGIDTGSVLADLLLGRACPSGKLSTTWTAWADHPPLGDFGDPDDTAYREGVYVGYRYYDAAGKTPLFPFGFGLGYTTFVLKAGEITAAGETVTVAAHVKNTGKLPGRETVQLYVSVPGKKLDAPRKALAAFTKTEELAPGERGEARLSFRLSDLASYDEKNARFFLEGGDYVLRLGTSSADTRPCGVVRLSGDAVTRKVRRCAGRVTVEDWRPDEPAGEELQSLPVLRVDAKDIPSETVSYDRKPAVEDAVRSLSVEELAYINVGAFEPEHGMLSVIGDAGVSVAGAAGESTGRFADRGLPAIVMADGPAGLRLSREYFTDEKGVHPLGSSLPESMTELLTPAQAYVMRKLTGRKPRKGEPIHEQYATAIPIGTALAQSWDTALAERLGDMVGEEMTCFGVHLWLAPALNIHRDIRCGRNFEYFSEDPLLSGRMAAAVTRGVQRHPGCGVTVKHFAANNQETDRYYSSSQVSERALREIYLRGFEICIREAAPAALMTSYNLLNGQHTSESRSLTESVLRCEFGYEGLVMTDWLTAAVQSPGKHRHGSPRPWRIAMAGGELVMPGTRKDWRDIVDAVREGRLSREQLEINASGVYRTARALAGKQR